MAIIITGASGFIGTHLCSSLSKAGYSIKPINRATFGEITSNSNWSEPLSDKPDSVIHLAACVHSIKDKPTKLLEKYRQINTDSTLNLAIQSAQAGVRRFIFISSIKVNGQGRDIPYTESFTPKPVGDYAISKYEAEQGLKKIAENTEMEIVILRPALVYGPNVGANFRRLIHWSVKGLPLPVGAIQNRRTLLYVGNLISAIEVCLSHPAAANQTFLISDNESISTPKLIEKLASNLDTKLFLPKIPNSLLKLAIQIIGKSQDIDRLLGSSIVDNGKICQLLNWRPPFTLNEGLKITTESFKKHYDL